TATANPGANKIIPTLSSTQKNFPNRGGRAAAGPKRKDNPPEGRVENNGAGSGDDALPRLGVPFFQARSSYDRRHDGTGLGLSIVKGLVALHGGEFAIASRIGEGTCVTFRLPVDCASARNAGAAGANGGAEAPAAPAG